MKISELSLMQVDIAVSKAQGLKFEAWDQCIAVIFPDEEGMLFHEPWMDGNSFYSPSQKSEQADEIILKHGIILRQQGDEWIATSKDGAFGQSAGTRELAAMMSFIESVYGDDPDPYIQEEDWVPDRASPSESAPKM